MSIKPEPALNLSLAAENGGLMQLSGPDALAFAQAQFANDLTLLADGCWQWSLWLSPKGRVLALFALLRLDARTLLLWLPDHPAEDLAQALQRFRFRSKVEITVLDTAQLLIGLDAPAHWGWNAVGSRAWIESDAQGGWARAVLDLGGQQPRTLCLEARADTAAAPASAEVATRWRAEDIAHGLPRLQAESVDAFTPHMLSLDRLGAFSVKKGCYPGQEIVARTHFLGQAKRGLLRLAFDRPVSPGARLAGEDGAGAQVVSVVAAGEGVEALAVGPREAVSPRWRSEDGAEATVLPLLAGLARGADGQAAR